MKTYKQFISENVTLKQLKDAEAILDKMFSDLGIDIAFTKHFIDRLNDARNGKPIDIDELISLFKKAHTKQGKKLSSLPPDYEAVLNDIATDINVPFVLKWDDKNQEIDLVSKTIMRKKNFMTTSPKIKLS